MLNKYEEELLTKAIDEIEKKYFVSVEDKIINPIEIILRIRFLKTNYVFNMSIYKEGFAPTNQLLYDKEELIKNIKSKFVWNIEKHWISQIER